MATKNITGLHDETIVVSKSGNTYNIAANAKVLASGGAASPTAAILEDQSAAPVPKNNIYNIDGRLIGGDIGIAVLGANDEIHIGATGKISGGAGIAMSGAKSLVVNDGEIVALQSYGVYGIDSDKMELRNNGEISGLAGLATSNVDKALIVNGTHGDILALQAGVMVASATGETAKIINHGSVLVSVSMGTGVAGGDGDETLVNDGDITGHVALQGGDDTVDDRGGTILGSMVGGMGDDTLITDKASDKLAEDTGGGDDTVKSTVNYKLSENVENLFLFGKADIDGTGTADADKLHGNSGDNTLKGLAGADELWGGKGADQLSGGADGDIFHFVKGDGDDTITDFVQGADKVDVSQWTGINDFNDIKSHAHDQDSDVVIELGNDSLTIRNIHKADLAGTDFTFPV